ncbi:MAG: hypothetical protein L0Y71_13820 [Gemmataceae bacterium]|nr:hypothetical protein [Gemmataceae bacterium]
METIEFNAVVDQDQVIRPPVGVRLPRGEVEVRVRPRPPAPASSTEALAPTRDWLLALATDAEQAAPDLPRDMAENHDHYAHGKPRP